MTQGRVDFLIIGTTAMASLLAGLLSARHGKSVLLQRDSQSGYRLGRGVDLSLAAITRPESWSLLAQTVPETTRLVTHIGRRAAIGRLDPMLVADGAEGKQALQHVRHMAEAYGLAAEPVPESVIGGGRDGLTLRDAVLLRPTVLGPALDMWLSQSGVRRLPFDAPLTLEADGRAQSRLGDESIVIGQTILADDDAIAGHLPPACWPALLQLRRASTIMTTPTAPLASSVMLDLDHGAILQQHDGGSVFAHGPGEIAAFAELLGRLLGRQQPFQHAGQASYLRLVTNDGAPAVGRVDRSGPDVLAGFGTIGAFMAPAVARWLSGTANPAEQDWFGARLVDRTPQDAPVSDIGAGR
ncbi:MAG: hypothetical protein ACOH2L_11780 [Devosia sp.]